MKNTHPDNLSLLRNGGEIIALFTLVGIGMGLSTMVGLSQLSGQNGTGLFSGIIISIVLLVSFLTAPVIAVVGGLRTGRRLGRSSMGAISSFTGSVIGLWVLVLIVIISVGLTTGGGGSATTTQPAAQQTGNSGGLDVARITITMLAASVPTGAVSSGAVFLGD